MMIVLLTDYGYQGPYVGQLRARILEHSPNATIVDLMHDLPPFNITAASYLIPAITAEFPHDSIFVCVVDPGVGSARKPVLLKTNQHFYIGPDNGIFDRIINANENCELWEILWRPEKLSSSFHGRDLFAVMAAQLFNKTVNFDTSLQIYKTKRIVEVSTNEQIIYFDNFGNAITSINGNAIAEQQQLKLNNNLIPYGVTFSSQEVGVEFWYYNSMNLVEIACNQSSALKILNLSLGQKVEIT